MKEQLITFETAKLAKEKEFNIQQEKGYYNHGGSKLLLWFESENYNNQKDFLAFAPTQSLLQKWLREEHGIDLYLDSIGGGRYYYGIYLNDNNDTHILQEGEGIYEEALEKGLYQALLLIKS